MFVYAIRIFELFHQPPISLAILCDARQNWRPTTYGFTTPGSSLNFEFTAVKLLDYRHPWPELEQSRNPFAAVVMAHLKTQETKGKATQRKTWKLTLVKRLYDLGYSRSEILNLFKFIDWIMILPKGLEQTFWQELKTLEEERTMPYITSVERMGFERGEESGMEKGERSLALRLLQRKFGELPDRALTQINTLSGSPLAALGEALLDFGTLEDLTVWLEQYTGPGCGE
jgi:predicted DNA-binding ribbon-helix-helix protein